MVYALSTYSGNLCKGALTLGKFAHRGHIDEAKMYCTINYGVALSTRRIETCMYRSRCGVRIYTRSLARAQELVLGGNWDPPLIRSFSFSFSLCYCFFLLCTLQVCFTFHVEFWRTFLSFLSTIALHHTTVCTTLHWT